MEVVALWCCCSTAAKGQKSPSTPHPSCTAGGAGAPAASRSPHAAVFLERGSVSWAGCYCVLRLQLPGRRW